MTKENKTIKNSEIAYKILVEPWVTEATTAMMEMNKYVFKVTKEATKTQVKKSVEDLYKVTILSVRTINMPRKKKIRGRITGYKPSFKKAIITLKEGDSINIYEGK